MVKLLLNIDGSVDENQVSIFTFPDKESITSITIEFDSNYNKRKLEQYTMKYLEKSKIVLADFTDFEASFITRSLIDDIYKVCYEIGAEELYLAISLLDKNRNYIIRNLMVYGFELLEKKRFIDNEEIIEVKMEVNQEYDFVDLI